MSISQTGEPNSIPEQPDFVARHWADDYSYLNHDGEFPYARAQSLSDQERSDYDVELTAHREHLWEQGQALLELAVAKLEHREPAMLPTFPGGNEPSLSFAEYMTDRENGLGLPKVVLTSNYSLANELFGRLGPGNEMGRSDAILSGLAMLVIEEVVKPNHASEEASNQDREEVVDPYAQALEKLSSYVSLIEREPECADGREKNLVLAAELLGEALRAPNSVRDVLGIEEVRGEDVEHLYKRSAVALCDNVLPRLSARFNALIDNNSKTASDKRKRLATGMERVLLTKYDVLFDTLDAENGDTQERAYTLLASMIDEMKDFSPGLEQGFIYELVVPVMYRYVATLEGVVDKERIWHASLRSDAPLDRFGYSPTGKQQDDPRAQALSRHKQQSQDALTGRVDSEQAPYGRVINRWQLKARTDVANFSERYDERLIKIRSSDAVKMFELAAQLNSKFAVDTLTMPENERVLALDETTHSLFCGILREIGLRTSGEASTGLQEITVGSKSVKVDIAGVIDEILVPDYQTLFTDSNTRQPAS